MNSNVDVVLPIYKPDNKVYEAIESVFNQSYKGWHLYIVDDASGDDSLNKIKNKYENSGKVSCYKFDKNSRPAACRNFAINQGNGDYIAFIDQDDVWMLDKLENQISYLKQNNLDAVHGNLKFIDIDGNIVCHSKWRQENLMRKQIEWDKERNKLAIEIFHTPQIRIISSLVTREIFNKVGGFNDKIFGGEDERFWFEVSLNGKIGHLDKILFLRRIHKRNTVDVHELERAYGYLKNVDLLKKKYPHILPEEYKEKKFNLLKRLARLSIESRNYRYVRFLLQGFIVSFPIRTIRELIQKVA